MMAGHLCVAIEKEVDGRWIAEIEALPGVMAYGTTPGEARAKVEALAWRVLAERRKPGELVPEIKGMASARWFEAR